LGLVKCDGNVRVRRALPFQPQHATPLDTRKEQREGSH